MGDFKKRPEVREFAVEVTSEDGEVSTSRGRDLDDVFRAILWDIQREQDWTTSEAAERLGIARSTYQSIMSEERYEAGKTTNIENLSKVCAAMKISPIALFESHEAYSPEARATVRFAEDAVFDRFRRLLTTDQARRLIDALSGAKQIGALDEALDSWVRLFPKKRSRKPPARKAK